MIKQAIELLKNSKIDIISHEISGIPLTRVQFGIMLCLILAGDSYSTRDEILAFLGKVRPITKRMVDVHVYRIRELFGFSFHSGGYPIETGHGTGYRIDAGFMEELTE